MDDRAVLIVGSSGSGKSSLALQLMAYGAGLVADDRTALTRVGSKIFAQAPDAISGLIEARGVGLLQARPIVQAQVVLVVDMDQLETDRLPKCRSVTISDIRLPLLHRVAQVHFTAAILQMLRCGRKDSA